MKKILILIPIFFCALLNGMHKDYDYYYSSIYLSIKSKEEQDKPYFNIHIRPTRIPIDIPSPKPHLPKKIDQKKEPKKLTASEQKLIEIAQSYEKILFTDSQSITKLKSRKAEIASKLDPKKNKLEKLEQAKLTKELALLSGYLEKYGIPDLECIQKSPTVHEAMGYYRCMQNKTSLDPKLVEAAFDYIKNHPGYQAYLKEEEQKQIESYASVVQFKEIVHASLEQTTDMIITTPTKVVNIHPVVDHRIEAAMIELQQKYALFSEEYQQAIKSKLQEMKEQGLLEIPVDKTREMIIHGMKHYFRSLIPNDPRKNPKDFCLNTAKYTAWAALHIMTDGVLLPVEKALILGSKLQELHTIDTSHMQPEEYAEMIAEQLADTTYMIASSITANKVLPKNSGILHDIIKDTSSTLRSAEIENSHVVTSAGTIVRSSPELETSLLQNTAEQLKEAVRKKPASSFIENKLTEYFKKEIGVTIKEFRKEAIDIDHIFSYDHVRDGIMNCGLNEDTILHKFIELIKKADTEGMLKENANQIETIINSQKVSIRLFIKDGKVLKVNGYPNHSARCLGNLVQI